MAAIQSSVFNAVCSQAKQVKASPDRFIYVAQFKHSDVPNAMRYY